jgi:molybdopterin synthase sulfur carrier subunit
MKVKYFATFRDLTGEKERTIDDPPATVEELLALLCARYGTPFRRAVFDGEDLSHFLVLLVNGRNVRHTGGLATPLGEDDNVSVFPMVAGG